MPPFGFTFGSRFLREATISSEDRRAGGSAYSNVVRYREYGVAAMLKPHDWLTVVELPSWLSAREVGRRAIWPLEHRTSSKIVPVYLGTSAGGYVLFLTMALSFLQWYAIASLFVWMRG